MRIRVLVPAALIVFLVGPLAIAEMAPTIPSLSRDQVDRLNSGEIIIDVVESAAPIGEAVGVIDASPETVMRIIEDFESYPEFMADVTTAEIRGEEGDVRLLYGVNDTPWPMDDRDWVVRAHGGPIQLEGIDVIAAYWDYVPGSGNIENTSGYWLAMPWGADGSQTLLKYRVMVDLGTWLPDFLKTWATENFLPSKISSIRERVVHLASQ